MAMHDKRREKVKGRLQNFIRRDRSAEQNGDLYDTNLLRSTGLWLCTLCIRILGS
jgi:hypothetical protein